MQQDDDDVTHRAAYVYTLGGGEEEEEEERRIETVRDIHRGNKKDGQVEKGRFALDVGSTSAHTRRQRRTCREDGDGV